MAEEPTARDGTARALSRDVHVALRNAATLTASLVLTWSVGLVVRFWLPRHLGPEQFGLLSFAEGLAATTLSFAGLGIDTYIQKEIPIRPKAASDFYGGTVVLRALLSALLVVGLVVVPLGARTAEVRYLLVAFGVGYLLFALNGSLAALLQANATVDELARANVTTKVVWGVGMVGAIVLHLPLVVLAGVFAASELLKLLILQREARRRLELTFRVDVEATRVVVLASLGFYAGYIAQALGWRLDVTLLGFLARDADVGWYGASQTLAGITLLVTPVLSAVLMPLFTRANDRSPEEMATALRRALEGILTVAMPVALFLALGAEIWVRVAFGASFAPAAGSLRALASLNVLIYLSILLATALVVQGRGWRLTAIATIGVLVHAALGLLLVPVFGTWLGTGGAGTGMAVAAVLKETVIMLCMLFSLGPGIIDGRRWGVVARTVLAALATTVVHVLMAPLGPWRLLVDLAVYPALAAGLGVLRPREIVALARDLMRERR